MKLAAGLGEVEIDETHRVHEHAHVLRVREHRQVQDAFVGGDRNDAIDAVEVGFVVTAARLFEQRHAGIAGQQARGEHRHRRVVPQLIMVEHILVAQRHSIHPLGNHLGHPVLDAQRFRVSVPTREDVAGATALVDRLRLDEGRIGRILFLRPMSVTPGAGPRAAAGRPARTACGVSASRASRKAKTTIGISTLIARVASMPQMPEPKPCWNTSTSTP